MKIRYLTPTHNAQAGDIKDIPDAQARVLILLKIAEKEEPKKNQKSTQKG
mgnify:CR=1 FL=1